MPLIFNVGFADGVSYDSGMGDIDICAGAAGEGDMFASAAGSPLVLVVDDYDDSREMFMEALSFSGFRVAQAATGREALAQAFSLLPDLILMDLSLPELSGIEATRCLKDDPRTRRIPIVALTGHGVGRHSKEAKAAGCESFLTKPCLPDALVGEIRRVLETQK